MFYEVPGFYFFERICTDAIYYPYYLEPLVGQTFGYTDGQF